MRRGNLFFAAAVVLATVSPVAPRAGVCRDEINMGRMPPRSDAECAQYDAGMASRHEAQAAKDAADMAVIDDYFRRYPTAPRPSECMPVAGMPMRSEVSGCRRILEITARINAYFEAHPNAPRPEGCSLPLRSGFLGKCEVDIEAAEAPPPPRPEWHMIIKDTVGCYRNGIYANGDYVGSTQGCIEIHSGQFFLLQPIQFIGKGGSVTFLSPLSYKSTSVSNGISSLTIPTDAFDPKIRHCRAKPVLLHQEVTCDD
jgi:hypothetical protein